MLRGLCRRSPCLPPLPTLHGDSELHFREGDPGRPFALLAELLDFIPPLSLLRVLVDLGEDGLEVLLCLLSPLFSFA